MRCLVISANIYLISRKFDEVISVFIPVNSLRIAFITARRGLSNHNDNEVRITNVTRFNLVNIKSRLFSAES